MGAVSSTTRTLLPTQTGVLRALANEVALHFELDRFRAERIGDPQRRDEDRITRLLAQVVDLRATDEDPRGDGRDTAPPQALSPGLSSGLWRTLPNGSVTREIRAMA